MPKERLTENKGLPLRWQKRHGAYYYRVPVGMEKFWDDKTMFRLGSKLHEAYKEWAKRLENLERAETVGQLLDRYSLEVVPTKEAATQTSDEKAIIKLRVVFGDMLIKHVKPQDIYGYYDARTAKSRGKRELQVFSHVYTKAVEWGLIDRHPFKGEVRIKGAKPRTRYIEDWELSEALKLPAPSNKGGVAMIQAYIKLKLLLGLRQGDMLRLKESDLTDDGITVTPHKTQNSSGKSLIYKWNNGLRLAIDEVRKTRPLDISKWLFCDRYGKPYVDESTGAAEGFSSMWQRFMARLLAETEIKVRFTEHDLRAKTASDAKTLEKAQEILAHTDSKITNRVYRRKPTEITLD